MEMLVLEVEAGGLSNAEIFLTRSHQMCKEEYDLFHRLR